LQSPVIAARPRSRAYRMHRSPVKSSAQNLQGIGH